MSKTFLEEVHDITLKTIPKINPVIMDPKLRISRVSTILDFDAEFLDKWGLDDSIMCEVTFYGNNSADSRFLYNGLEVKPECLYIRGDNYTEVPTIRSLQECIKQDTYAPDIKPIEKGIKL